MSAPDESLLLLISDHCCVCCLGGSDGVSTHGVRVKQVFVDVVVIIVTKCYSGCEGCEVDMW